MSPRARLHLLLPTAFLAASVAIAGCGGGAGNDGGKPVVTTTAPQLDSLLKQLAGPGVAVETVVPATADVHEIELQPSQVRALRDSALVLRPGRQNDAWAQEALGQIDATQVDVSKGIPGDQRHWWMDPTAVEQAARSIAAALDQVDPGGKAARAGALARVEREFATLDRQTRACLATVPAGQRKIVTDHDAAGAYAARYGLTVVGTISPGAEPEAAPSAQRVAELEATMRTQQVAALFPIAPHGSALSKTIAERGGAVLGEPLWADALPGATHSHGDAATPGAAAADEQGSTLQAAARLNGEAVAEALGADRAACAPLLG